MKNSLQSTKKAEIKREWHLLDAKDQILGRLASQIAGLLMGKRKAYYVDYLDCGDYVVVTNCREVKVTGKKEKEKVYTHYSGYPGGLKSITLGKLRQEHPERVIENAVKGMLPRNKLLEGRMKRLKIFPGEEHPYKNQLGK